MFVCLLFVGLSPVELGNGPQKSSTVFNDCVTVKWDSVTKLISNKATRFSSLKTLSTYRATTEDRGEGCRPERRRASIGGAPAHGGAPGPPRTRAPVTAAGRRPARPRAAARTRTARPRSGRAAPRRGALRGPEPRSRSRGRSRGRGRAAATRARPASPGCV